jgi:myosin-1
MIIHMKEDYDSFIEVVFKTEFLLLLSKKYQTQVGRDLTIKFSNR